MSTTYITAEGDMLDDIAFKVYQDETMINFILQANPGLVEQPLILPHGLEINLPDAPVKPVQKAIENVWG
jgi:phage tail protein X